MIATDIEERVSLAVAVRRYLTASDRHHEATAAFEAACQDLRQHAARESRYVVQIDYRHWLLEVDAHGNFELEQIELL